MKIIRIESEPVSVPLKRPYTIAFKSFDSAEMVAVRALAEDGSVGLGSATPEPAVTGESFADCRQALASDCLDELRGGDLLELPAHCRRLAALLPQAPAARAAVEMALHDLWGKLLGRPLVDLLGRAQRSLPTSITIGIKSSAECLDEAEEYLARGFRILKVKIGTNLDEDLERLALLAERVGTQARIRIDANQGYRREELPSLFAALRRHRIEFCEQPVPAQSADDLRSLSAQERRLLAADESLVSEVDALALLQPPLPFGIFNLKLMKCGGIRPALRIAAMAETAGVDLMWGCMDESAVGIAAALHAALAAPNTRYLDLDGSFDLARDFAAGGFLLRDGELSTLDLPGLGVEPARS